MNMEKVTLPNMSLGAWTIERFVVDRVDFGSQLGGRAVPVGEEFTRLMRGREVIMSDTPAEMRDLYGPVFRACGSCLINGLGIGLVLRNILKKPEVTDVTVVELSRDLIEMVGPHYSDHRVTIVCADALAYQPPKAKRYQMVWHDIWDNICADNLPQMHTLHKRYGRRADWQGSWCRNECERPHR